MRIFRTLLTCLPFAVAAGASAQTSVNFDNLAVGTAVTTQYTAVTFSFNGASGTPTIGQTAPGLGQVGTTSSGTRFLKGPPDASGACPTLRMVFANLQRGVRFNTGISRTIATPPPLPSDGQVVTVVAYDNAGAIISSLTQGLTINAASSGTLDVPVILTSTTRNIRRVEISVRDTGTGALCRTPYIDDLSYCDALNSDDPVVYIGTPSEVLCICPSLTLSIGGTLDAGPCGGYASDRLEYRSISDNDWSIAVGPYTALPSGGDSYTGVLYTWAIPATLGSGYYYLRAVLENDLGRSGSDVVLIYVDRSPPLVVHPSPSSGTLVRGTVCLMGEISDQFCGVDYTVDYRPSGAGTYTAVPTGGIQWPRLAEWNTSALVDGAYDVRITAADLCGNVGPFVRTFTVDNTPPVARIDAPIACADVTGTVTIRGQATDAHLSGWSLQYTGGDTSGWTTISTGTSTIPSGGVLGAWNTANLRRCAYTLRLRVSDAADNNCGSGGNQSEFLVSVQAGCAADFNHNGSASVQDIFDFLSAYFTGCP